MALWLLSPTYSDSGAQLPAERHAAPSLTSIQKGRQRPKKEKKRRRRKAVQSRSVSSTTHRSFVPAELLVLRLRLVIVPQTNVESLVESVSCSVGPQVRYVEDRRLRTMQAHPKKEEKKLNASCCVTALGVAAVAADVKKETLALLPRLRLFLLWRSGPLLK